VLASENSAQPKVTSLPAPFYHLTGWDGHTGGVTGIHLDAFQLIAVNSCVHQVGNPYIVTKSKESCTKV